jgi:hypothetical protein
VGKPAVPRKPRAARERAFVSGFTSKAETGDNANKSCGTMLGDSTLTPTHGLAYRLVRR